MIIDAPVPAVEINEGSKTAQAEQKLLTMEGGMLELRDKLIALSSKQEETTTTANRLVEDLQKTLKIITEQQDTLKQHGEIIKLRQDQMISHQEWLSAQHLVQGEQVNNGRLFQEKLREDMADCAREVLKVAAAHQNAWCHQSEVNQRLSSQQQETMQAAQEWYTAYNDWERHVPPENAPCYGKQTPHRRNSTGQCQEGSGSSLSLNVEKADDCVYQKEGGTSNDRSRIHEKKPISIPPDADDP